MSMVSLRKLLQQDRPPHQPVAEHAGHLVTWQQFRADVAAYAATASTLPCRAAVALFDDQTYPFAAALFGLWSAGCVPVLPGNATAGTRAQLADRVTACWGAFEGGIPLAAARAAATGGLELAPLGAATRLELFTSGSSGEPKPVTKNTEQLDAELRALEHAFGASLGELPIVATVSHQHIYGLLFKVLWPLVRGRVFESRLWRDSIALAQDAARQPGGVVWIASPAHLKRLSPDYPWTDARKGIKEIFSSGGPLPDAAAAEWQRGWGRAPLEIYGSTETGGIGWRRQSDSIFWRPLPGVSVTAAPDGVLQLRSPHLPASGWTVLDDGGRVLEDDRFELTGRRDRIVKIEEKRLSLPELEACLAAHPLLTEAVALVLPGTRPQLAVVAVASAAGRRMLAEERHSSAVRRLRRDLGRTFEAVLLPRRWRFVESLPFNSQGKLEWATLASLFDQPVVPAESPRFPIVLASRTEGGVAELRLRIPPTLAYLPGHFPREPILPGVVQIHWAIHYGRILLQLKGQFAGMEAVKFRQLCRPGRELDLHLKYDPDRNRLAFRYLSISGEHGSGRVLLHDAGPGGDQK